MTDSIVFFKSVHRFDNDSRRTNWIIVDIYALSSKSLSMKLKLILIECGLTNKDGIYEKQLHLDTDYRNVVDKIEGLFKSKVEPPTMVVVEKEFGNNDRDIMNIRHLKGV